MNLRERLRCRLGGHQIRGIGKGHHLLIFECQKCHQVLMSHVHHPYLILPVSRDELATLDSVVFDETVGS